MRRLAAELQVAPGALYYHVKNKQHLLVLLANYILDKKAPKELLMPADSKDPEAVKESLIVRGQVLFETIYSIPEFPEVIRLALATNPERLKPVAAIAYDGVAAVGASVATGNRDALNRRGLTLTSGFQGAAGIFRLREDGTVERGLAVATIEGNQVVVLSPAPRSFSSIGF